MIITVSAGGEGEVEHSPQILASKEKATPPHTTCVHMHLCPWIWWSSLFLVSRYYTGYTDLLGILLFLKLYLLITAHVVLVEEIVSKTKSDI